MPGLSINNGADVTATESSFFGYLAVSANDSDLILRRSRVLGEFAGVFSTTLGRASTTTIEDSLIRARGKPLGEPSVGGIGVVSSTSGAATQSTLIRGSTIWALADATPTAANAAGRPRVPQPDRQRACRGWICGTPSRGSSRRSITRPRQTRIWWPRGSAPTPGTIGGTITAESSSFNTVTTKAGGSAPAPGSGSNVAGDPGFVDEAAHDFRLAAGSRLIDAGNPAFATAGELDLLGAARSLDGNGDCTARPDIGAYEVRGDTDLHRAEAAAGAARQRERGLASRDSRSRRSASSAARARSSASPSPRPQQWRSPSNARPQAAACAGAAASRPAPTARPGAAPSTSAPACCAPDKKAGRGSISFSGRFSGRALALGSYRARLVATDPQGAKSAAKGVTFRVVTR